MWSSTTGGTSPRSNGRWRHSGPRGFGGTVGRRISLVLFGAFFLLAGALVGARAAAIARYWPLAGRVGRETGIDPRLLLAVMRVESDFRPDAVSRAGAVGLMQVMPETAAWVAEQAGRRRPRAKAELAEPEENVLLGALYLGYLLRRSGGDLPWALAAYNGGPANARRWGPSRGGVGRFLLRITFPETRAFVAKVLFTYAVYRLILPSGQARRVVSRAPPW